MNEERFRAKQLFLSFDTVIAGLHGDIGIQTTILGALGITIELEEGIEFNFGCVHFGIDL